MLELQDFDLQHANILFHLGMATVSAPRKHRLVQRVVFSFDAIIKEAARHDQGAALRSIDVDKYGNIIVTYSVGEME